MSEEHPNVLSTMFQLASSYWNLARRKQAQELLNKATESRARVLGEEHPDTLTAMANLASTQKDLCQHDLAISFMGQSATVSSRVTSYDHFDCDSRNEQVALWSSVTGNFGGDGGEPISTNLYTTSEMGVYMYIRNGRVVTRTRGDSQLLR
jgi:hypothetical protein